MNCALSPTASLRPAAQSDSTTASASVIPLSVAASPSTHFSERTAPIVFGSKPVTAVVPESPLALPMTKRVGDTTPTPGTAATVSLDFAGIGLKPSWFCTISAAEYCSSITLPLEPLRLAAKIATITTSARPTISAAAVTAVRCGWRMAFSRARTPVRPCVRASGAPSPRASGRTSSGARNATPNIISTAPKPTRPAAVPSESSPPNRP